MNPNTAVGKKPVKANSAAQSNGSPAAEIYYPESDRKIMGETDFHFLQIQLLMELLQLFFDKRTDVYVSSDIFVYYEEGNTRRRFAPDVMVCFGIENQKRRTYKLWEEKVVPSVIFEIASSETWEKDVTSKRKLYEDLGVQEFYIFDPEYKYLPQPLRAYHLEFGELVRQSAANNRIFSPALGLELVDTGEKLRFFDSNKQAFVPTAQELVVVNARFEVELARLKDEIERLKESKK